MLVEEKLEKPYEELRKNVLVSCICDYCGEEFEISKKQRELPSRQFNRKDACSNCKYKKQQETSILRYGAKSYTCSESYRKSDQYKEIAKFTDDQLPEIYKLYIDNKISIDRISKMYNTGNSTVTNFLTRHGVPLRGMKEARAIGIKPNANPQKIKEICEMYLTGKFMVKEIGDHFGCSHGYISRVLTENGLRTHKPKRTDGYTCDSQGYLWVRIPDDDPMVCMRIKGGLVSEHRLMLAKKLDRPLTAEETVHHIDGNKQNNNPENLQLRVGKHGSGQVIACTECGSTHILLEPCFQCKDCGSVRMRFGELA